MRHPTIVAIAVLVLSCTPEARLYDAAPDPEPEHVAYPDPRLSPVVVPEVKPEPPRVEVCLEPGRFTCEDACAFAHAGMCPEFAGNCGVNCGSIIGEDPDWDIDDTCAPFGLRLVVTPLNAGADCAAAQWIGDMCNESWQPYCCTRDGSPIQFDE